MSGLVALGEPARVGGFGLAGVTILSASTAEEVEAAWVRVPYDTGVLILTPAAAEALRARLADRPRLLWVVMPE